MSSFIKSPFIKSSFIQKKVTGYVGSLVIGSAFEMLGQKISNEPKISRRRILQTPKGQEISDNITNIQQQPFDDKYVESFNPKQWEVPKLGEDLLNTFKYIRKTSKEDRREDFNLALQKTVKNNVIKTIKAPLEIPRKIKQAKQTYDVFNKDSEALEQQSSDLVQQKSGQMMQSLGRNNMLKAPGYLMPGPIGFIYRSFFTAKMLGNAGRQLNEISELHQKAPGPFKEQIQKRIIKN